MDSVILDFLCCCFQGSQESLQVEKLHGNVPDRYWLFEANTPPKMFENSSWWETRRGQELPFQFVLSLVATLMPWSLLCSSSANSSGKIHYILIKNPSWSPANSYLPFRKWRIYQPLKATEKQFKENIGTQDLGEVLKTSLFFSHL